MFKRLEVKVFPVIMTAAFVLFLCKGITLGGEPPGQLPTGYKDFGPPIVAYLEIEEVVENSEYKVNGVIFCKGRNVINNLIFNFPLEELFGVNFAVAQANDLFDFDIYPISFTSLFNCCNDYLGPTVDSFHIMAVPYFENNGSIIKTRFIMMQRIYY